MVAAVYILPQYYVNLTQLIKERKATDSFAILVPVVTTFCVLSLIMKMLGLFCTIL